MKRVLMALMAVSLLGAIIFGASSCDSKRSGINPGDKAPDVVGVDLAGSQVSLWAVDGKLLLVNFWASWCGPCIAEMPALQALHEKFKQRGFKVVGIAVDDTPESIREIIDRFGITYPIIIDTQGRSKRNYQVKGFPESFILDGEHRVMVVRDPADGSPQTRLWGPREWDSPAVGALINSLLK